MEDVVAGGDDDDVVVVDNDDVVVDDVMMMLLLLSLLSLLSLSLFVIIIIFVLGRVKNGYSTRIIRGWGGWGCLWRSSVSSAATTRSNRRQRPTSGRAECATPARPSARSSPALQRQT